MPIAAGYFDESADHDLEERCFTVAGYIGAGAPCVVLDMRWKDLLGKYDIEYFKASELENGFGQFAKFRDDPQNLQARFSNREKNLFLEIKTAFVDLICQQAELIGVSATIIIRDYKLLQFEEPETAAKLPPIYQLCGHLVMMEAGLLMLETNIQVRRGSGGELQPIFDSHQEYSARFKMSFDTFAEKNPNSSRYLCRPIFEDDQTYRMLQAADLYAYEIRRTIGNHYFDDVERFRKAMERLVPQSYKTYVLDYKRLKRLADAQPDKRAVEPLFQSS